MLFNPLIAKISASRPYERIPHLSKVRKFLYTYLLSHSLKTKKYFMYTIIYIGKGSKIHVISTSFQYLVSKFMQINAPNSYWTYQSTIEYTVTVWIRSNDAMFSCRWARPREGEVQIHLRRLGPHFHRIGWLNLAVKYPHPLSNYLAIIINIIRTVRSRSGHGHSTHILS